VYDTKVIGTTVDRGFLVEDTSDDFVDRTLVEVGVDLEARAFRTFDLGGAFGIQKLQHAIEPRVSYLYVNDVDQDELPLFDFNDRVRGTNGFTYSLVNRLKARAVPEREGDRGRVWELLRFSLSQTYDLENPLRLEPISPINLPAPAVPTTPGTTPAAVDPGRRGRLSDLIADLIFQPAFGLWFRGTVGFDPYETDFTSATTDLTYETKDILLNFGTRHGLGGELQFIQGELRVRLAERWAVRFLTNFDVLSDTIVENRLEVSFREQCWAITAAFIDRTDEDEFHVTVSLLELGSYGFGRAFGFQ
jgi:LPS-assembly protein